MEIGQFFMNGDVKGAIAYMRENYADSGLTIATILSAETIFPNPIFTNCILIPPFSSFILFYIILNF